MSMWACTVGTPGLGTYQSFIKRTPYNDYGRIRPKRFFSRLYAENRRVGGLGLRSGTTSDKNHIFSSLKGSYSIDVLVSARSTEEFNSLNLDPRQQCSSPCVFETDRRRLSFWKRGASNLEAMTCEESKTLSLSENDLLVVGPGVLGSLVGRMWLKANEGSTVSGQTNTTKRHEELRSLGIVPMVRNFQNEKFPYVIFCAPPSGSVDYPAEVRAAAQKWNGQGSLLFTSSSALYDVDNNGICDEQYAPSVPRGRGPRTENLLNAEEEVLKVGGNVVRLAGLYTLNRGAHMFYLGKGTVEARPDHLLNLIHYEDAAALCIAILKSKARAQIYMGCDNSPVSRREMMDAVNKSGKYEQKFKEFTSVDGALGKRMNNHVTRLITGWKPKYESFPSFLGVDVADDQTEQ